MNKEGSEVRRFRGSEGNRGSEESRSPLHLWTSGPLHLYFFEIFAVANFAVIQVLLWPIRAPLGTLPAVLLASTLGFLAQVAVGMAVRAAIAWRRGHLGAYLGVVRSPLWIIDTLRFALSTALFIHTYGWIKLAVPLLHGRLFDQELWDLDAKLMAGHAPNEFFLALFSAPAVLRFIDWSYANIFFVSLVIAMSFFGSSPSRRLRHAFMDSNVLLWLTGAWLYVAVPSLGPAYRFPDIWLPLAGLLDRTQTLQRLLMTNYQNVLAFARGVSRPVSVLFGVAAFPSLHVAFQTLVFLWMRRVWRGGEVIFGIFVVAILVGSLITGWHYLIDGLAGMLLAWLCYALSARAHRMRRMFAIRLAARTF